jgi:sugar phosphate isomerase/epimerase
MQRFFGGETHGILTMTPPFTFGCSTYCCTDLPLRDALELIRKRTRRIEILSEGLHDLFLYNDACTGIDADFSVHAPCSEINLAGLNERMRTAGVQVIDDLCVICDAMKATTLVVHPGYSAWDSCRGQSFAALLQSLDALAAIQQEHDVRIGVENMGSWECCHFKRPDLIEELDQRDLGFVLDVGHAHLNGALADFLVASPPVHVHLHDNDRITDSHAACGTGSVDFYPVLECIPKSLPCIIEVRMIGDFGQSVAFLEGLPEFGQVELPDKACGRPEPWP